MLRRILGRGHCRLDGPQGDEGVSRAGHAAWRRHSPQPGRRCCGGGAFAACQHPGIAGPSHSTLCYEAQTARCAQAARAQAPGAASIGFGPRSSSRKWPSRLFCWSFPGFCSRICKAFSTPISASIRRKILTTRIELSKGHYTGRDPIATFYNPLLTKIEHLPGVQGTGVIDLLPVQAWGDGYGVHITGQPPYPPNLDMGAETRYVSPGYFDAMGLQLTRGRLLSHSLDKSENLAGTMVVNEAFHTSSFPRAAIRSAHTLTMTPSRK